MHIYILGPKLPRWNFLQISQLSVGSRARKLFRRFLNFSKFSTAISRNLWHHLATLSELPTAFETAINAEKKQYKHHQNRTTNRDTSRHLFKVCHPRTNSPPASGRDRITKKKHTNTMFPHLQHLQHCAIFPKLYMVIELVVFTKKWKCLIFLGPHSHPAVAIEMKFCTDKRTHVPVGPAEFDVNRCNDSPQRGEKPDFWPVSKFNTGSLPLHGILPVKTNTTFSQLQPARIVQSSPNFAW